MNRAERVERNQERTSYLRSLPEGHPIREKIDRLIGLKIGGYEILRFCDVSNGAYRFWCRCLKCNDFVIAKSSSLSAREKKCMNCFRTRPPTRAHDKIRTKYYKSIRGTPAYEKHIGRWIGHETHGHRIMSFCFYRSTRLYFKAKCLNCGFVGVADISRLRSCGTVCIRCKHDGRTGGWKKNFINHKRETMERNEIKLAIDKIYNENRNLKEKVALLKRDASSKDVYNNYFVFLRKLEEKGDELLHTVFKNAVMDFNDNELRIAFPAKYLSFKSSIFSNKCVFLPLLREVFGDLDKVSYSFEDGSCQQQIK